MQGTHETVRRPDASWVIAQECAAVRRQLADLELQHATALELLGERNERVDELQQDLLEAREIYRSQLLMLCPLSSEDRPR